MLLLAVLMDSLVLFMLCVVLPLQKLQQAKEERSKTGM